MGLHPGKECILHFWQLHRWSPVIWCDRIATGRASTQGIARKCVLFGFFSSSVSLNQASGLTWAKQSNNSEQSHILAFNRACSINCFLYETNLLYQPIIYWLSGHLTKHLSMGNLKEVSFLSICRHCWRYLQQHEPGRCAPYWNSWDITWIYSLWTLDSFLQSVNKHCAHSDLLCILMYLLHTFV